jgi:uncharacterized protein (TIGR03437 family)
MRMLFPILCLVSASALLAQTTPVTLSFKGGGTGNGGGLHLTGSGTVTPFGAANITITGDIGNLYIVISPQDNVQCGQGTAIMTDQIYAGSSGNAGVETISGTATVTGGTCNFLDATGSFTYTITAPLSTSAASVSFKMSGSGTVTFNKAALTDGYPIAGPGGPGYPISGPGGSGLPVVCVALTVTGPCSAVEFQGPGGGSALVFNGSASVGGPVFVVAGPGGTGKSSMSFEGTGSNTSVVLTFQGPGDIASLNFVTPAQSAPAQYTAPGVCPGAQINCWLSTPAASGSITSSSSAAIPLLVNSQGLAPGIHTSNIVLTITPSSGPPSTIDVPITVVVNPPGPNLTLSQTGLQFQATSGMSTALSQFVSVSNPGSGAMSFSASASTLSGGNWLTVSQAADSVTSAAPAAVNVQANPAGLPPGLYFGKVDIVAAGATNSPQSVEVVFTILQASTPLISPAALTFVAPASGNPASQTVQLIDPASGTLTVSSQFSSKQGSGWLSTTSFSNEATSAEPFAETVNVNTTGLAPGVYLGTLDLHVAETNADYPVAVMLVAPPSSATAAADAAVEAHAQAASCMPTQLLPVFTNLEEGFVTAAGIPVPVQVTVVDDCGSPLDSGSVVAAFWGSDAPVSLVSLGNGQWTGSWMPHGITGGTAAANAGVFAASFASPLYGSAGVNGTLSANTALPVISAGGVVSAASVAASKPLAPGGYISIFGSHLASGPVAASSSPLPTTLGGIRVFLGGEALPLQFADAGQINAIVPYDAPVNSTQQVIIEQNGSVYSMPELVTLGPSQPAVFTQDGTGSGAGVIVVVKADGDQFEASASNPASPGDALVIYCAGLGSVTPAVSSGAAAPISPLSETVNPVTATIGGQPAQVLFSGLTPGFAGLYQVNVIVPTGIASGANVPVILTSAGTASPPVTVAIQ